MLTPSRETAPFHHRPIRPLATIHHTTVGTATLFHLGTRLTIHTADTGFTDVAELPSEPLCAITAGDTFIIMTRQGPVRLAYSTEGWDIDSATVPADGTLATPYVTITARTAGTLTAHTDAVDISGVDFSRDTTSLTDFGAAIMATQLTDAYSRLISQAALGGLWIQPVILRYRIISPSGTAIHTSAPMVISPHGWQCCSTLSATCSRSGSTLSVPAMAISANAFSLSLYIDPQAPWLSSAAAVQLLISPQLHPVDPDATAPTRLQRTSTSSPVLTIAIPGTTSAMASLQTQRIESLRQALARTDTLHTTLYSLPLPLTATPHSVTNLSTLSVTQELKLLHSAISEPVSITPLQGEHAILRDIAPPNSFYARSALLSADTVIWGDITPIPSVGHPPADITASFTTSGPWTGAMRIHMQSGQVITSSISGTDLMPAALAPVVTYPHPQASMLELFVSSEADGQTMHAAVPLSPAPSGTHAIYIHPTLSETPLAPTDLSIPDTDSTLSSSRHQGMLVAASVTDPLVPLAALQCSQAPILAITPAVRTASSWDFSRCRFYAFSPQGIFAVALNAARSALSAAHISPHGITHPQAAVHTPHGVMALSGSQLLSVTAARASVILPRTSATRLGWDAPSQSLWMTDPQGNILSRHIPTGYTTMLYTATPATGLHTIDGSLFIAAQSSLHIPSDPAAPLRPIFYARTIRTPHPRRIRHLEIGITATDLQGTITLHAHPTPLPPSNQFLIPNSSLLIKIHLSGTIQAPIRIPVIAPPRPYITLTIQAHASPDLHLSHILLNDTPIPLQPSPTDPIPHSLTQ